jgi:hypothetical protein
LGRKRKEWINVVCCRREGGKEGVYIVVNQGVWKLVFVLWSWKGKGGDGWT